MRKILSTLFVALIALLFAGAATAAPAAPAPADQPVPQAQPAQASQPAAAEAPSAEAQSEAAPDVASPKLYVPLFEEPITTAQPDREPCGDVVCPPKFYCCNPLQNLCVREGQVCIQ